MGVFVCSCVHAWNTVLQVKEGNKICQRGNEVMGVFVCVMGMFVCMCVHDWRIVLQVKEGDKYANEVMQSWADAEWFTEKPKVAEKITTTVFFVKGETNTDDLSPATEAWLVAACCSVLQRVAACCSVLQRVAVYCSVLHRVAVCCNFS